MQIHGYMENFLKFLPFVGGLVSYSHVESLSNVLAQSIMYAYTLASTNYPNEPGEVLENGRYGCRIKLHDSLSLRDGILKVLDFPVHRELLCVAGQPFEEVSNIAHHLMLLGLSKQNNLVTI